MPGYSVETPATMRQKYAQKYAHKYVQKYEGVGCPHLPYVILHPIVNMAGWTTFASLSPKISGAAPVSSNTEA